MLIEVTEIQKQLRAKFPGHLTIPDGTYTVEINDKPMEIDVKDDRLTIHPPQDPTVKRLKSPPRPAPGAQTAPLYDPKLIEPKPEAPEKPKVKNYVGMPAGMYLNEFGSQIWSAFDDIPYLVGSALRQMDWRDIDVRLILDDEKYEEMGLGQPARGAENGRWCALCMAFSALGKQMTGLPVDFQIQQRTHVNETFPKEPRHALGLIDLRLSKIEPGHGMKVDDDGT